MKSIVAYVRSLLGWSDEDTTFRTSFKRDRVEEDFSSDEDGPSLKRLKQLKRTTFPDIMSSRDVREKEEKQFKTVRYVPIQVEPGHPSTSTPNNVIGNVSNRIRTVPMKLVNVTDNGLNTPCRKPRLHTPVRSLVHAEVEDDDENEVTFIESKPTNKKLSKVYINLEDEDNENDPTEDDVIFVKKVPSSTVAKPYNYYVARKHQDNDTQYYRLTKKSNMGNVSPRTYNKFVTHPGITKGYKRITPIPKFLQSQKLNGPQIRNKCLNINGNGKSTLSELYNLEDKKKYQELIRKFVESMKSTSAGKPVEVINLAEDAASFRNTQRAQKKALNDIRLVEKRLGALNEGAVTTEYDPITVASINSSDSEIEIVPSETSTSSSIRIDPINTLRDSFKDKAIIADDWLSKFNSKYRKKRQETQEKVQEARRECDIISKVNSEQKIAHLEHKLKYELSIPESLFEEPQPTVELPKLTPEQEKLVDRALGPGPPGQMLIEKFNLRIHRRDIQTLAGLNWLNDEVINFYMNLLMQRCEERTDLPRVYATNTFFYPKLMQSGQAGLRRWTRKVDVFAHDIMVIPVHLGVHWCLSLIDFREKQVSYLDSMGGRNQACLDALMKYLRDEHADKKGQPFDDAGWKAVCLKDIPQQMNGSDCGMFACTFAEFTSRGAPYTFTQAHMPYLRRKAALEILLGKLLL